MLIDNTLFLREKFPEIRQYFRMQEDEINQSRVSVLDSKKGFKTIRYKTEDKREFMVHSMYDPIREAEKIISSYKDKINIDTHVFFYGVGMGYHIKKFQEFYPNNTFSLYEPLVDNFYAMSEHIMLESILGKNMKNIYLEVNGVESEAYLNEFILYNENIQVIMLPSYKNIISEKINSFSKRVKEIVVKRLGVLHLNKKNQKIWVENSIKNFNSVLNTPNILLDIDRKQFEGRPAIIVSAGPSLAEDIEQIRYIKENNLAYIFAVGSAINSMIAFDVMPDAVFTYDPNRSNQFVFKQMVENSIDTIPMVFGSSVGYETINNYDGPMIHFITSQDNTSTYFLSNHLNQNHIIEDSPSIAVMTFQVLNKLGSNPIIFAGQNLGYLYDRKYSQGIDYDFVSSEVTDEEMENAQTTLDVYGNEIKTTKVFNNMRNSLESFVKHFGGNYINTTKGGANIEGVPFQPIEDVISKHLTLSFNTKLWWEKNNEYDINVINLKMEHLEKGIDKFKVLIAQLNSLMKSMESQVKLSNKTNIENLLSQFNRLFMELNQNIYYVNFLSFYIRVHVEFMKTELKQAILEKNLKIRGRKIAGMLGDFITHCVQGSEELEELIKSHFKDLTVNS